MAWTGRTLEPGTIIAGYRIESVIGRGGMGVVYRAVHTRLGRTAAVKVLSPAFAEEDADEARFLRESQLAASLDHPNVLQVYDAGDADGVLYIAMRYVDGGDLRGLLQREGSLPPERTLAIVRQIASALDAAHATGLIHRDVKPANILVGDADHIYLADFGVAKPSGQTTLTRTGSFLGTVDYCPPEQINGEPLDKRADVYALGCLTFHCLTGQPPFVKETEVAVIMAHLSDPLPAVTTLRPDLPRSLDGVIATGMAKNREARYATAGELAAAFEAALQSGAAGETRPADLGAAAAAGAAAGVGATPPPPPPGSGPTQFDPPTPPPRDTVKLPSEPRRRRTWLIAGIAALIVIALGAGAAVFAMGGGETTTEAVSTTTPPPPPPPPCCFPPDVAATIRPLVPLQQAVNRRLVALSAGDAVGPVQTAAEALDRAVLNAQGRAGGLEPTTETDRRVAGLLNKALQRQADYVAAVEVLPSLSDLTRSDAVRVVDRAGAVDAAYLTLSGAGDNVPEMPNTRRSALRLVALVPPPHPPRPRSISLAPLLVGITPDDPAGEGRCFGPYKATATLTIGGRVRHDNFVSCGDYGYPRGDPTRATGQFRFRSTGLPAGLGLTRFTATVGVDEDSSSYQAGTTVTWTLYYRGNEICSRSTTWSGGTSAPTQMSCELPSDAPTDTDQIVITQDASVVSGNQFWAGVQDPTVTAVRP